MYQPHIDAPADDRESAVRRAIEYANEHAGRDNAEFVRVLNQHFRSSTEKRGHERKLPMASPETPTRSFQIYNDPRYLKNARELARRTLGGLRIIGGAKTPPKEFLDCVAVGNDAQWGCSGTLIAANVVVTAGHCAEVATRIFLGSDVTKAGTVVRVRKRVRHPQYHKGKHNDLMVLLLGENVTTVQPRKIAKKTLIDKATDGRVVGFGNTDPGGFFGYGVKRFVDVPIASNACRGKVDGEDDKVSYGCDPGFEFVAGRPLLQQDTCTGDSGGPFYILADDDQWLLAGATSRATDSAMHNCGDGGVYVRLDRYRSWINGLPGVNLPKST